MVLKRPVDGRKLVKISWLEKKTGKKMFMVTTPTLFAQWHPLKKGWPCGTKFDWDVWDYKYAPTIGVVLEDDQRYDWGNE